MRVFHSPVRLWLAAVAITCCLFTFSTSVACKPCNSALKSNYFPVAGNYLLDGEDPQSLANERPYLIYPIGDSDDDPETLLQFHGTSPQPVAVDGYKRARALVTIQFFKLDDFEERKNLFRERAVLITALFAQLEIYHIAGSVVAVNLIHDFTAAKAPTPTACVVSSACTKRIERRQRLSSSRPVNSFTPSRSSLLPWCGVKYFVITSVSGSNSTL
jgi:hypothetical protein